LPSVLNVVDAICHYLGTFSKLFRGIMSNEEWTYNFGPNQFICTVILKNGRVTNIQVGDYGYIKHYESRNDANEVMTFSQIYRWNRKQAL